MGRRWLLLILLWLTLAACSRPTVDLPDREVPVSEEAAQRFEEKLARIRDLPNGDVKLTFTESEVTSYVRLRLTQGTPPLPVQEPTFWFSGGQVYVKGRFAAEGIPLEGDAILVIALRVENARLHIAVRKAIIGGVPVPERLLERLSALANERLSASVGAITVKDLQILEGEAIVVLSQ